jgi:predicted phage-related endonuclease
MTTATAMKITDGPEPARGTYIGGPDAAAILGVDRFRSPVDVAARLKGLLPDVVANWRMKVGLALEPLILSDYAERYGVEVKQQPGFKRHPKYHWSGSHIDGLVPQVPRLLEAKTTGYGDEWGEPGTDHVPQRVLVQVAYYLPIWECDEADVLVSIRNGDPVEYHIARDPELEQLIYEQCDEFWQRYVVGDDMPPLDAGEGTKQYLAIKHPRDTRPLIKADDRACEALRNLRQAYQNVATAKRLHGTAEAEVKALIGDAAGIDAGELGKVSWKLGSKGRVSYAALCKDSRVAPVVTPLLDEFTSAPTRTFRVPREWGATNEED